MSETPKETYEKVLGALKDLLAKAAANDLKNMQFYSREVNSKLERLTEIGNSIQRLSTRNTFNAAQYEKLTAAAADIAQQIANHIKRMTGNHNSELAKITDIVDEATVLLSSLPSQYARILKAERTAALNYIRGALKVIGDGGVQRINVRQFYNKQLPAQYEHVMQALHTIALPQCFEKLEAEMEKQATSSMKDTARESQLETTKQAFLDAYDGASPHVLSPEGDLGKGIMILDKANARRDFAKYAGHAIAIRFGNVYQLSGEANAGAASAEQYEAIIKEMDRLVRYQRNLTAVGGERNKRLHEDGKTHLENTTLAVQMKALEANVNALLQGCDARKNERKSKKAKRNVEALKMQIEAAFLELKDTFDNMKACFGDLRLERDPHDGKIYLPGLEDAINQRSAIPKDVQRAMHEVLDDVCRDFARQCGYFKTNAQINQQTVDVSLTALFDKAITSVNVLRDRVNDGLARMTECTVTSEQRKAVEARYLPSTEKSEIEPPVEMPYDGFGPWAPGEKPEIWKSDDNAASQTSLEESQGALSTAADDAVVRLEKKIANLEKRNAKAEKQFQQKTTSLDSAKEEVSRIKQNPARHARYKAYSLQYIADTVTTKTRELADICDSLSNQHTELAWLTNNAAHIDEAEYYETERDKHRQDANEHEALGVQWYWERKEENLKDMREAPSLGIFNSISDERFTDTYTVVGKHAPVLRLRPEGAPLDAEKVPVIENDMLMYDYVISKVLIMASGMAAVINFHFKYHDNSLEKTEEEITSKATLSSCTFKTIDQFKIGNTAQETAKKLAELGLGNELHVYRNVQTDEAIVRDVWDRVKKIEQMVRERKQSITQGKGNSARRGGIG